MRTSVDQIGKNKLRLSVEVPSSDVSRYMDRTYRKLAGQVRIPGFRPGKAPKAIIDQRLGKDFVRDETLREILPDLVAEAVTSQELDIVAPPEIEVTSFEDGQDLTFDAVVETRPEPELKEYSGLKVDKPPTDVADEEVEEQLGHLRTRFASLEVVERAAEEGDFALIDLRTYQHEETIEEATAQDLLVEVGGGMIVPELDTELQGKRRGDILRFTTTLPERFGEHGGKQVGMQVLVKDVKARRLPELDDELAQTVSEFDTLDELRSDLRQRLEQMKQARADAAAREHTLDAFAEHGVEVELPDGMIELEVDRLVMSLQRMLQAQGATIEQYLQSENIDYDALRQRLREQGERNLTVRLGLEAVARAEGLEVTDDDRTREVDQIAQSTQRDPDEVRQMLDEGENWAAVEGDIIRSKALDLLVSRAEVTITEEEQE